MLLILAECSRSKDILCQIGAAWPIGDRLWKAVDIVRMTAERVGDPAASWWGLMIRGYVPKTFAHCAEK